jgi:hypothetical protein
MTVTMSKKPKTECREMDPNPSKDQAMHEGDDPSFWNKIYTVEFCLDSLNSYPYP